MRSLIIPDKGIAISSREQVSLASFGSALCRDISLIPFIKINYSVALPKELKQEKCHCQHLDFSIKITTINNNVNPNPGDIETVTFYGSYKG